MSPYVIGLFEFFSASCTLSSLFLVFTFILICCFSFVFSVPPLKSFVFAPVLLVLAFFHFPSLFIVFPPSPSSPVLCSSSFMFLPGPSNLYIYPNSYQAVYLDQIPRWLLCLQMSVKMSLVVYIKVECCRSSIMDVIRS